MEILPGAAHEDSLVQDLVKAMSTCISETTTTAKVASTILDVVDKHIKADVVQLLIHDGEKLRLLASRPSGLADISLEKSVCATAIARGRTIRIHDRNTHPLRSVYAATVPGMLSELAVPVFATVEGERTPFAVINLEHSGARRFSRTDARRVELITQFAVALLRHADFAELSHISQATLKHLYDKTDDTDSLFSKAVSEMMQPAMRWHQPSHLEVVVFENPEGRFDVANKTLRVIYSMQAQHIGASFLLEETACSLALGCDPGVVRYFPDFAKEEPNPIVKNYKKAMTAFIVPLRHADRVIGAINVEADAPGKITPFARMLFKQIAGHLAPLIELIRVANHHRNVSEEYHATKSLAFRLSVNTTHAHHVRNSVDMAAVDLQMIREFIQSPRMNVEDLGRHMKRVETRLREASKEYNWIVKAMERTEAPFRVWEACLLVSQTRQIQGKIDDLKISLHTECDREFQDAVAACAGFEAALYSALDNATTKLGEVRGERRVSLIASGHRDLQGRRCMTVTVSDNGPGMDDDTLQTIFDPKKRTTKKEGSGYGIWFARVCLRSSGGDVTVRRNDEGGIDVVYRVVLLA